MSVRLHYPKPDETWQSVVATFLRGWPRASRWRCAELLLGRPTAAVAYDYPRDIRRVATRLPSEFGLTPEAILLEHTSLPLHRPFLDRRQWTDTLQAALNNRHMHFTLGIGPSRIPQTRFLRICPHCIRSDVSKWGCAYWHRSHQLPGAFVCAQHGEILIETNILTQRNAAFELASVQDAKWGLAPNMSEREQVHARNIASDLQSYLNPQCPAPGLSRLQSAYFGELTKLGFVTEAGRIKNTELTRSITAFFGASLLRKIGCSIDVNRRDHWLLRLLRSTSGHQAPVRHALLTRYLGYDAPTFMRTSCYNFLSARAGENPRITSTPTHPRVTRDAIEHKQRDWLEVCCRETGNRRQKYDALYSWLWRNCRNWLLRFGRLPETQLRLRLNKKRALDVTLAREVRLAMSRALADNAYARLSRRRIAERTSRPNLVQIDSPGLPETMAAVKSVTENVETHAQRKLILAAQNLSVRQKCKEWRLVRAAKLNTNVAKRPPVQRLLHILSGNIYI